LGIASFMRLPLADTGVEQFHSAINAMAGKDENSDFSERILVEYADQD